ncbi:MAG: right-handed parallel beta-helix repeat-containing protein [Kofleriaceae bacterium]
MRPVLAPSLSAPNGPVLRIDSNSDVSLEHLAISGARGAAPDGNGIECGSSESGQSSRTLRLLDVVATNNAAAGVSARGCNVVAMRTKFEKNVGSGIAVYDAIAEIDGCEAISNSLNGFTFDYGSFVLTNSLAARNGATGIEAFTPESGTRRFELNTISDNQTGASSNGGVFANNLIVRNRDANLSCSGCTQDGNLILGSDIAAVRFVSPDVPPYNYRLMPGSVAIDAATSSAIDHDIDGDPRPTGAGRDVGADELAP